MELIMSKELYVKAIEDLYSKMQSLAYEFNIKIEELDTANKVYANNMASQKSYIKSEQVPKKAKIVLPAPKKSLFHLWMMHLWMYHRKKFLH